MGQLSKILREIKAIPKSRVWNFSDRNNSIRDFENIKSGDYIIYPCPKRVMRMVEKNDPYEKTLYLKGSVHGDGPEYSNTLPYTWLTNPFFACRENI